MDANLVLDVILKGEAKIKKLEENVAKKDGSIQILREANEELLRTTNVLGQRGYSNRPSVKVDAIFGNILGAKPEGPCKKRTFPWDIIGMKPHNETTDLNGSKIEGESNDPTAGGIFGNTILILGGIVKDKPAPTNDILMLKEDGKTWQKLPYKLRHTDRMMTEFGVVYLNGALYQIGIDDGAKKVYKLEKGKWNPVADMTVGRRGIRNSSLEWNGLIWVVGGCADTGTPTVYYKSIEVYFPERNLWRSVTEMKFARMCSTAAICNDKLMVFGGWNPECGELSSVECFDPESGVWALFDNMPTAVFAHSMGFINNSQVFIMGGNGDAEKDKYLDVVFEMDSHTGSWKKLHPMKYARGWAGGVTLKNEIWIIGGHNGKDLFKSVEIFDGKNWRSGPELPYECAVMSAIIVPKHFAAALCEDQL